MTVQEIQVRKERLTGLFEMASAFADDPEVSAHWARYMCVLVSGFLETSTRDILSEYVERNANKLVVEYVNNHLERFFQNPRIDRIMEFVGNFSPDWRRNLVHSFAKDNLSSAIETIVNDRNSIAHGKDVDLTVSQVKDLYQRIVKVVDIIEKVCC